MIKSISILLFTGLLLVPAKIDKFSFYKAFESNSKEKISQKIDGLNKVAACSLKQAYIGALKMKLSQFEKTPKEKAEAFKIGRDMLENEIKNHPNNSEYRFLRLAIQENVPKVLKYHKDIEADVNIIVTNYKKLEPTVKTVVRNYAKQSANLDAAKLK